MATDEDLVTGDGVRIVHLAHGSGDPEVLATCDLVLPSGIVIRGGQLLDGELGVLAEVQVADDPGGDDDWDGEDDEGGD